jgi:hypothetical protein
MISKGEFTDRDGQPVKSMAHARGGKLTQTFRDLSDAIAHAEKWWKYVSKKSKRGRSAADTPSTASSMAKESDWDPWSGCATYTKALELAKSGNPDGYRQMKAQGQAMLSELGSLVEVPTTILNDEPGGYSFDVERVVQGDPDHWMHVKHDIRSGKSSTIVTIVFNGTASASISTDVMIARGVAVGVAVILLEQAGLNVELIAGLASSNHQTGVGETYIPIKRTGDDYSPLAMAYAIAHPSFLRRLGFALWEYCSEDIDERDNWRSVMGYQKHRGYGRPCELTLKGDLYIPSARPNDEWSSPEKAIVAIKQVLEAQGALLKEAV